MTRFEQTNEHSLDCNCAYCFDVDPNKSVARELEKYVGELSHFALSSLDGEQQNKIHLISQKILLLRRYFPQMELPAKHSRLVDSLAKD